MSQEHPNANSSKREHLNFEERKTIARLLKYVEENVYFADVGQRVYEEHRLRCGAKNKVIKCAEMVRFVERKIKSPAR